MRRAQVKPRDTRTWLKHQIIQISLFHPSVVCWFGQKECKVGFLWTWSEDYRFCIQLYWCSYAQASLTKTALQYDTALHLRFKMQRCKCFSDTTMHMLGSVPWETWTELLITPESWGAGGQMCQQWTAQPGRVAAGRPAHTGPGWVIPHISGESKLHTRLSG